jgi:hypothetical protein
MYFVGKIYPPFRRKISSASLLDVSAVNCEIALVDETQMIRNQMRTHNRPEIVAMEGSPYASTPEG